MPELTEIDRDAEALAKLPPRPWPQAPLPMYLAPMNNSRKHVEADAVDRPTIVRVINRIDRYVGLAKVVREHIRMLSDTNQLHSDDEPLRQALATLEAEN